MNFAGGQEGEAGGIWPRAEPARQMRLAAASLVLLILGAAAFPVDLTVKSIFDKKVPEKTASVERDSLPTKSNWRIPGDLRGFLNLCEVFAHGLGVAMIGLAVIAIDPASRRWVPRILLCAYLGGILAVSIKLLVARTRPEYFAGGETFADTFIRWLPGFSSPTKEQSFPSGHAATAAALAAALAWRYPQGTWFFALLAMLAGMQRLAEGAHYLSDVLIGGGIGLAFAAIWLPDGWLSRGLSPLESLWKNADPAPPAEPETSGR